MVDHRAVRLHKLYMGQLEWWQSAREIFNYTLTETRNIISFRMAGALDQGYTRGSAGIPQMKEPGPLGLVCPI